MAYACLISLHTTIEHLLNSSHISLASLSLKILEFAKKELNCLQETLKRLDSSSKSSSRKKVNALDARIRDALCKFEDVLESHVLDQIDASQSEENTPHFSIDLQNLGHDVDSLSEELKKMEEEYVNLLDNPEEEDDEDALNSSRTDIGGEMIGLSDIRSEIRDRLNSYWGFSVVALSGMAGIGKTAVAWEAFHDPKVRSEYECHAWATIGRKCRQLNEIMRDVIAQLDPDTDTTMLTDGDGRIAQHLKEILKKKVCLVVLDDIWDISVWDSLKIAFPDDNYGRSRILVTTRLQEVAKHSTSTAYDKKKTMRLLDKEESWDLLCKKVFGEDPCPPKLRKAGEKIAENCDGLPLTIVTIADHLSRADKSPEYWEKVAEKQNSVFRDAYAEISKVLIPSFEYSPQHLKSVFLYMGVFPENYEIPTSKIVNLCIAEGLLEPNIAKSLEDQAENCLDGLLSNSLAIVCQTSTSWWGNRFSHYIKTCRLHSSMWYLCHNEVRKNKFFHALNKCADALQNCVISQRRLCFHNNTLLGIDGICNLMEIECASTARSLLCFGPYNQYPVPICCDLRLLRVLDILRIRLHEFPVEVLKRVQLRYLALTYNGDLPASISKLRNLQFLIIHRHQRIKSSRDPSYVPLEIWDMRELKHLEIMGSDLPNPDSGTSLEKLRTLLGVSTHTFTEGVLERISNLVKLGIRIELVPGDDSKSFQCLNQVSHLQRLKSFTCIVINPELEIAPPWPTFFPIFPSGLKKLHLSGLGYPWEYMKTIAKIPKLEVLKLRCYAFRGPKWEAEKDGFYRLRYLLIEDTDLVHWEVGFHCFKWLGCLSLKHCYKLEKLNWNSSIPEKVELINCNPSAMTLADQLKKRDHFSRLKEVCVHSSWDNVNINTRAPVW